MDFAPDPRTEQLRAELLDLMATRLVPAVPTFRAQLEALDDPWAWSAVPVL